MPSTRYGGVFSASGCLCGPVIAVQDRPPAYEPVGALGPESVRSRVSALGATGCSRLGGREAI